MLGGVLEWRKGVSGCVRRGRRGGLKDVLPKGCVFSAGVCIIRGCTSLPVVAWLMRGFL